MQRRVTVRCPSSLSSSLHLFVKSSIVYRRMTLSESSLSRILIRKKAFLLVGIGKTSLMICHVIKYTQIIIESNSFCLKSLYYEHTIRTNKEFVYERYIICILFNKEEACHTYPATKIFAISFRTSYVLVDGKSLDTVNTSSFAI